MLQFVADRLGRLCDEVVFLGGCTTALFITNTATPDVRYTLDVDCIVDVISLKAYHQFEEKIKTCGFKKSMQDSVICRWRYDDVILDVMPTDLKILGFSNRWYKAAVQNAQYFQISDEIQIKIVTSPYFLATKLEAFKTRGGSDYFASHDFEDIISVIDGRIELIWELDQADSGVRKYLADSFSHMYESRYFHDALPGHLLQYGNVMNDRLDILLSKVKEIAQYVGM